MKKLYSTQVFTPTSGRHAELVRSFTWLAVLFLLLPSGVLFSQNCTVNANIDQTICANATLSLVGQASGLFPGGTAVVTWSQVSGPSAVITSPHSLTTTVTSIIGGNTYKFSLSFYDFFERTARKTSFWSVWTIKLIFFSGCFYHSGD